MTTPDDPGRPAPTPERAGAATEAGRHGGSSTSWMVVGTIVAALGAYALQFGGARLLGPSAFAPVSALWTLMFIVTSVVHLPLEQQVTRAVTADNTRPGGGPVSVGAIALASVVGAGFVLITLEPLFAGNRNYVWQAGVLFTLVGVAVVRRGELAGASRYRSYGLATVAQAVLTVVIGFAGLVFGWGAPSLVWALALGPLANLAFRIHDKERSPASAQRPGTAAEGRFLGAYIAASLSSQALLAGAPLAVVLVGGHARDVSTLFVLFTLFRAPLTLVYAMQARWLPALVHAHLTGRTFTIRKWMHRGLAAGLLASPLAFGLGWSLGPTLIRLFYGPAFLPTGVVAACAAAGVVLATTTHMAGQVLVAQGRTGTLAAAWTAGVIAALVSLPLLPGLPTGRVSAAFLVGELVAVGVLAVAASRRVAPAPA